MSCSSSYRTELNDSALDTIWITIRPQRMPRDFTHITIGAIYHPPKANDWTMSQHIATCVDKVRQKYLRSGFIILGDFNHMSDSYIKRTCSLHQIVTKPTHMNSTIDLCYTNMRDYYGPPTHEPGIGISKHQVIIITPNTVNLESPKQVFVTKRCQGPKERGALCRSLQAVNWDPLYTMPTCEEQYEMFENVLNMMIEEFLPIKIVKQNTNDHPWITDDFHRLINLRQFYFHNGNKIDHV